MSMTFINLESSDTLKKEPLTVNLAQVAYFQPYTEASPTSYLHMSCAAYIFLTKAGSDKMRAHLAPHEFSPWKNGEYMTKGPHNTERLDRGLAEHDTFQANLTALLNSKEVTERPISDASPALEARSYCDPNRWLQGRSKLSLGTTDGGDTI